MSKKRLLAHQVWDEFNELFEKMFGEPPIFHGSSISTGHSIHLVNSDNQTKIKILSIQSVRFVCQKDMSKVSRIYDHNGKGCLRNLKKFPEDTLFSSHFSVVFEDGSEVHPDPWITTTNVMPAPRKKAS